MKIVALTLYTDQLESQRAFHRDVFGLDLLDESDTSFSFRTGWSLVTFEWSNKPHLYHYCYLIPRGSMNKAIDWMSDKVDLISTDDSVVHDHAHWNAKAIYYYDGGGNIAEFIIRDDLDYQLEDEFSLDSMICINEIGAPSEDIKGLSSWLERECRLGVWKGNLDRFGANGSQKGMFLLVNNMEKNTWFPTEHFPQSSNFEVTVDVNGITHSLLFNEGLFKRK